MRNHRLERIEAQLARISSEIIRDLKDPRIGFISIIKVDVSPDLQHAKIFVSIMGDDDSRKECLAGLQSAAGFIRHELFKKMQLKYIPGLTFYPDNSIEEGARLLEIMSKLAPKDKDDNE